MTAGPADDGRSPVESRLGVVVTSNVRFWERAYAVITLVTSCRGFDLLIVPGEGPARASLTDSSTPRFVWLAILYGIAIVLLLIHHRRDVYRLLSQNKLLLLVVAYVLLSTMWAFDPGTSLRRAVAFALTATFCVYLALRYPLEDILELAAWAVLIVAVASVFAVIFVPEIGREAFGRKLGWWKGICGINTSFGRFMALGVLIIWCLRRTEWRLQRYDVLVLAFFIVCTYQAHAATSTAALFAAFVSVLAIWSRSLFNIELPPKLFIGALLAIVAVATLPLYSSEVFALLQRDETLTNRIFIWRAAYEQGWLNPIFGVGYDSFWVEGNAGGAYYNMFGSDKTRIGNGHNGYLDAWLELGFVGLGFVALLFLQAFSRVAKYLTAREDPFAEFYGGLLVFIVIYSVAEKVIFLHSEFAWMMFMTGLMALRWRLDPLVQDEGAAQDGGNAMPQLSQRAP